jgi:hypothetical protein
VANIGGNRVASINDNISGSVISATGIEEKPASAAAVSSASKENEKWRSAFNKRENIAAYQRPAAWRYGQQRKTSPGNRRRRGENSHRIARSSAGAAQLSWQPAISQQQRSNSMKIWRGWRQCGEKRKEMK